MYIAKSPAAPAPFHLAELARMSAHDEERIRPFGGRAQTFEELLELELQNQENAQRSRVPKSASLPTNELCVVWCCVRARLQSRASHRPFAPTGRGTSKDNVNWLPPRPKLNLGAAWLSLQRRQLPADRRRRRLPQSQLPLLTLAARGIRFATTSTGQQFAKALTRHLQSHWHARVRLPWSRNRHRSCSPSTRQTCLPTRTPIIPPLTAALKCRLATITTTVRTMRHPHILNASTPSRRHPGLSRRRGLRPRNLRHRHRPHQQWRPRQPCPGAATGHTP